MIATVKMPNGKTAHLETSYRWTCEDEVIAEWLNLLHSPLKHPQSPADGPVGARQVESAAKSLRGVVTWVHPAQHIDDGRVY